MTDPRRYRRGKPGGLYVEKATGHLVVASQFIEQGVAIWVVDPMLSDPIVVSSDDFAEQYAMPV